jgi:hypothetical protein
MAVIFFQGLKRSFHARLAFRVSVEKFDVILIGLPLYTTWCLSEYSVF